MNERLKIFIEHLKKVRIVHNFADFATQMGKNRSIISEMINGKRVISELFVQEIVNKFPQLNKDWLLTGTGSMLKNLEDQPENPAVEKPEDRAMIDRLFFLIESQKKDIETLIQLVKEKDEKIDELLDELLTYKGDKGDAARNVGDSSAANVG